MQLSLACQALLCHTAICRLRQRGRLLLASSSPAAVQVAVSLVCAVFTGIRGGLFTLAMVRMNVRVRTRLFHSLLGQDIGFYDVNKTGAPCKCTVSAAASLTAE